MLNVTKNVTISRGSLKINKQKVDYNAATIPNINLWFDASFGVVSQLGTNVGVGSKVFGWKDRLTDVLRASNGDVDQQPTLAVTSTGKNCLRFTGAQGMGNATSGGAFGGSRDYTVIAVVTRKRASGGYYDYIFSTNNGVNPTYHCAINNLSATFQPTVNLSNGTTALYKNGSTDNLTLALDETCVVAITTQTGVPAIQGSPYQIGFGYIRGTNYFLTGDISELILVTRTVPPAEIQSISSQLMAKYEI